MFDWTTSLRGLVSGVRSSTHRFQEIEHRADSLPETIARAAAEWIRQVRPAIRWHAQHFATDELKPLHSDVNALAALAVDTSSDLDLLDGVHALQRAFKENFPGTVSPFIGANLRRVRNFVKTLIEQTGAESLRGRIDASQSKTRSCKGLRRETSASPS